MPRQHGAQTDVRQVEAVYLGSFLGELDGLAKGQQPQAGRAGARTAEHAAAVAESARRALSFLHSGAAASSVKPVTSKGSTLNTMGITTEEDSLRDGPGTSNVLVFGRALHEIASLSPNTSDEKSETKNKE